MINNVLQGGDNTSMWWILKDILPDDIYGGSGEKKAQNSLIIVSFNERVAPGPLSILTNYGYVMNVWHLDPSLSSQTTGM